MKTKANGRPVQTGGIMNKLKNLYKKDKQLALEVAKVLGFKIKADTVRSKRMKQQVLNPLDDCYMLFMKAMKKFDVIAGDNYNKKFDEYTIKFVSAFNDLKALLKKEYKI